MFYINFNCVFAAKKEAEKQKMKEIETDAHITYSIGKQMKQENKDFVDEKCIWDGNDVVAFNEEDKKKALNSIMKGY